MSWRARRSWPGRRLLRQPNRAADRAAELIHAKRRLLAPRAIVEKVVGVEGVVAQEFVERAMRVLAARTRRDVDDAAAEAPELRRDVIAFDLEFLRGFDRWNRRYLVGEPSCRRHTVNRHLVRLVASAVDRKVGIGACTDWCVDVL